MRRAPAATSCLEPKFRRGVRPKHRLPCAYFGLNGRPLARGGALQVVRIFCGTYQASPQVSLSFLASGQPPRPGSLPQHLTLQRPEPSSAH